MFRLLCKWIAFSLNQFQLLAIKSLAAITPASVFATPEAWPEGRMCAALTSFMNMHRNKGRFIVSPEGSEGCNKEASTKVSRYAKKFHNVVWGSSVVSCERR
eukprot:Blabericola_migrator_1__9216@NODE_4942_length_926_cov_84_004657_g3099_i0_p3_GENE_NODE_4942_length_926_cov_84_004657_g3099_i0NODE_4942_length_926_cov_84_004657_g3099_i0_p3_ORF_typecomplete_len102_score18_17_NODE_4942_length_926_cov_84_004657_g3099_i049354